MSDTCALSLPEVAPGVSGACVDSIPLEQLWDHPQLKRTLYMVAFLQHFIQVTARFIAVVIPCMLSDKQRDSVIRSTLATANVCVATAAATSSSTDAAARTSTDALDGPFFCVSVHVTLHEAPCLIVVRLPIGLECEKIERLIRIAEIVVNYNRRHGDQVKVLFSGHARDKADPCDESNVSSSDPMRIIV